MKTVVINVDTDSSAKLLMDLAKKLRFKAHILSEEEKEDIALLKMMEHRKDEETFPVAKTYSILRKAK